MECFATFSSAANIKKILDSIVDLVQDANLYVDQNGIHMQSWDVTHSVLCYFLFPPSAIENFQISQSFYLGLNIKNLQKILHCVKDDDKIYLSYQIPEGDVLGIRAESSESSENNRSIDVELPLIEISAELVDIPIINYDVRVDMDSKSFSYIIKDLINMGDVIQITANINTLKFKTITDEGINMTTSLDIAKNHNTEMSCSNEANLHIGSRYMRQFIKGCSFSPKINIFLQNEIPVIINYVLENGTQLKYICAPKDID